MTASSRYWLDLVRRGFRRNPKMIAMRLINELRAEAQRFQAPIRERRFDAHALLDATEAHSIDALWHRLSDRPFLARVPTADEAGRRTRNHRESIVERANRAVRHEVDLLGSGPIRLDPLDWQRDAKSGVAWEAGYARRIRLSTPDDASDVKFPWELSRLQWLIPAGQAYVMTGDEDYARSVKRTIQSWIADNPYAYTVNWSVAMEAAIRIFSWTWFFHVFKDSVAWDDPDFRSTFLTVLYLHAEYVETNLEKSDVSGNHFTADAAGLSIAGLFFGIGPAPRRWSQLGWEILQEEIVRQTHPDGVNFEASTAYHRLVTELFLLPAIYRERLGEMTPAPYRKLLEDSARFVAAYSRPDGSAPHWGDADDGRALPFGTQPLNDHRYLIGLVGFAWNVTELKEMFSGESDEIFWIFGEEAVGHVASRAGTRQVGSTAFRSAGVYVMRTSQDQIFIDAGPVGMRGRGGHGHNDCLSFDAFLNGAALVVDPGTYVYTGSYDLRNLFRSTKYHNTPVIDRQEQNRFLGRNYLWSLQDDAKPRVLSWETNAQSDSLRASHSGYERLPSSARPIRSICLDRSRHRLCVRDEFTGEGEHDVAISLQLGANVTPHFEEAGLVRLDLNSQAFILLWGSSLDWSARIEQGWVSPSYGIKVAASRLVFSRLGLLAKLTIVITPTDDDMSEVRRWAGV
jgi:hypothetical protein